MGIVTGIITYLVIWWTVLFATLPLRVRSQREVGQVSEGSEPGAPANPHLLWKAGLTTAISCVLWVFVFLAVRVELVDWSELGPPAG